MKKAVSFLLILKSITWITLIANEKTNFLPDLKNFHDITLGCCSDYKKCRLCKDIFKNGFPKALEQSFTMIGKGVLF